jgi:hypothetical protein
MNIREYNTQRSGTVVSNILGYTNMRGDSINRQNQWNQMSPQQKILMRKKYKDSDRDGVPDRWDCRKYNPFRQDEYDDEEYNGYTEKQKQEMREADRKYWKEHEHDYEKEQEKKHQEYLYFKSITNKDHTKRKNIDSKEWR